MALEESAVRHRDWECQHVPGLLQTEDYARAILETNTDASPDEVEHRLQHRRSRQSVLTQDNLVRLWAILDEDVLNRPVGGAEVMRSQLGRLVEAARQPNVTVQVVPRAVGAHGGMRAAFMVLDFAETAGPPALYLDTATGGLRTSQPAQVRPAVGAASYTGLEPDEVGQADQRGGERLMTAREDLRWRKASRSGNDGGNCVEVAGAAPGHAVRDSKNPSGPILHVDLGGLFAAVKSGHLNR